ncbi:MAG: 50S ribosomal protein L35 [Oscillospiraceae bacterium]
MPKIKSHSGAKKRFKMTKNGKVKRGSAFRSHILTKKDRKLKRGFRKSAYADKTNVAAVKEMLPYS